ncbi:hypothetical protein ES695_02810 [Candidatus Atribacteria bacterium 1244-E10-H5-B2]|nr:MAG: hypothetical protein ES695_02810 [Candidatus Atribacteria bacterium 1244-E10-H5-B2]
MKKLLIMLMVVAMASFLFVGCLGVTPEPDPEPEPDPVLPLTVTPVIEKITNVSYDLEDTGIISLYSSATQYINEEEVTDGILVTGFAPKYSEVNIYVGGVIVGTSTAYGLSEYFIVFVSEDNLGADGTKTIYATAKELGFAESDPSTEYKFTLDTVAPEMVKVTAVGILPAPLNLTVTATFSEELDKATAENPKDWIAKNADILPGKLLEEFSSAKLISPKVVELKGATVLASVGNILRVAYEDFIDPNIPNDPPTPITDLAGNPAVESSEYCFLESEE